MHPATHLDEQAHTGGAPNDPDPGTQALRAAWTLGSAYARDHGGFGAVLSEPPAAPEHMPDQGGLPREGVGGFGGLSFLADDIKRLAGIVLSFPSGVALAFGQNTKAREFDFDREVMDSIVRDFHLDFETPRGKPAR